MKDVGHACLFVYTINGLPYNPVVKMPYLIPLFFIITITASQYANTIQIRFESQERNSVKNITVTV